MILSPAGYFNRANSLLKFFMLMLLLSVFTPQAKATSPPKDQKMLTDGWYYASISSYNYATFISADYTDVKVKVKDGLVIIMRLNTGVLHNLINSQGYQYTGGKLTVTKDKRTEKLEYSTQVSISNGRAITTYSISIMREAPDDQQ